MDLVTAEVGRCCPVALQLGAEGPGEGIVWKCVEPELQRTCGSRLWFKSKAVEFMTETRKPRALRPPPAAAQAEAAAAARQFVKECVTERRLQQVGRQSCQHISVVLRKLSGADLQRHLPRVGMLGLMDSDRPSRGAGAGVPGRVWPPAPGELHGHLPEVGGGGCDAGGGR